MDICVDICVEKASFVILENESLGNLRMNCYSTKMICCTENGLMLGENDNALLSVYSRQCFRREACVP